MFYHRSILRPSICLKWLSSVANVQSYSVHCTAIRTPKLVLNNSQHLLGILITEDTGIFQERMRRGNFLLNGCFVLDRDGNPGMLWHTFHGLNGAEDAIFVDGFNGLRLRHDSLTSEDILSSYSNAAPHTPQC